MILYVNVPDHFLEREGLKKKLKSIELLSECFLGHSWGMLKKTHTQGQVHPSISSYFLDSC